MAKFQTLKTDLPHRRQKASLAAKCCIEGVGIEGVVGATEVTDRILTDPSLEAQTQD
jgi:hypothetical protein